MANARLNALLSAPRKTSGLLSSQTQPAAEASSGTLPYEYGEEDPRSLLSTVVDVGLGAVGAVGNLLDLPGSMVRDTLTGNNPLDQVFSPLSSDNRVSGREMLTHWGLTKANKETGIGGWVDDPMEGVRDVAGFAAEMAFDPLSLVAGWSRGAAGAKTAVAGQKTGLLQKAGNAMDAVDPGFQAARATRGLLTNIADPLHLRELGEKMQVGDKLSKVGQGLKSVAGHTMDLAEKSPYFGQSFGAARQFTRTTGDEIARTTRQLFDSSVAGANKAINQSIMKTMTSTKWGYDDAVKSDMIGMHRQINQQLIKDHGEDIFDRLDAGSEALGETVVQAARTGESLIEPFQAKMDSLGFTPEQIEAYSTKLSDVTSDTDSLGGQFSNLQSLLDEVEETHLENVSSQVIDPMQNDSFLRWKETGNRPVKELFSELGWKQEGGDLVHESGGVIIGQQKKQGNWFVFDQSSGELERIGNFRQKSAAIQKAHEFMRSANMEAAGLDFEDTDDFLKMFADHDKSVIGKLKQANDQNQTPGWLALREEVRAAAEGAQHDFRLLSPEAQEVAQRLRPSASLVEELSGRGFATGPLQDEFIEYAHRRQGEDVIESIRDVRGDGEGAFSDGPSQVIQGASPSTSHRDPAYMNWMTGSAGINRYFRDPELVETMNRVNQDYATGQLKGKIGASQASSIRETLRNVEIGGTTAEKLFDDLIDGGMIDLQKLNKAVSSIGGKIADQASGVVTRKDGGATRKWVKGGQGRQFYVFDDITSTSMDGIYNNVQFRVNSEALETIGEAGKEYSKISYGEARSIIEEHKYVHQSADKQAGLREKTIKQLENAERDGLPVYIRDMPGNQAPQIVMPQVYDTIQKRLTTQLRNLGKKFNSESVPSEEQLELIQRQQLIDFTRKKYGDEIDDRMPRRDDYGGRMARDYRNGLTGNQLSLSDDQYVKLVDEELVSDDLQEAMEKGLVYELVDSRIEKAVVPKLYSPDGGYLFHKDRGVFTNDPLVDHIQGSIGLHDTKLRADAFETLVDSFIEEGATYGKRMDPNRAPGDNTLERLLDSQKGGVNPKQFLEHMAKKRNPKLGEADAVEDLANEVDRLKRIEISSETWKDLAQALDVNKPSLLKMPGVENVVKYTDAFTRAFKAGVLGVPARITRDFTSAMLRSVESGMIELSSPKQAMRSFKMGNAIATGKHQKGFAELLDSSPGFRKAFESSPQSQTVTSDPDLLMKGAGVTEDEAVFNFFQDQYYTQQGGSYLQTDMDVNNGMDWASEMGSMEPLLESITNFKGLSSRDQFKSFTSQAKKDGPQALNPLNITGMPNLLTNDAKLKGKPLRKGKSVHEKVFNRLGQYTDSVSRASAVIDQMKRGSSFNDAFSRAKDTLVNYDPRRFTQFEQDILKRIFPFYSFLSSQVPYVIKELRTNPTGGLGMSIRAQRHAQDNDYVPMHMRDKAAIPLGMDENGNQSYIAALGLMHEDAVAMLNPDIRSVLSNVTPLLKAPVEWATGASLFMESPTGGRQLAELDPPLGRIVKTVGEKTGLLEPTDASPRPLLSPLVEHVASNSPLARVINTTRTLLDDRKTVGDKLLNTFTGLKVATVSPESQQAMLGSEVDKLIKEEGYRPFTRYQIPKGEIATLRAAGKTDLANRLEAGEKVRDILNAAQKRRKKGLLEAKKEKALLSAQ